MERMVGIRHVRWWLSRRQMRRFLDGNPDAPRLRVLFQDTLDAIWRGAR